MKFIEILHKEVLYECIYSAFAGDKKLIEKYHVVGDNLEDCVRDTHNKIIETSNQIPLDWYALVDEEKAIGYLVVSVENNLLYSFGLNIDYRQNYSDLLFEKISELLDENFICLLWNKNVRAINYLLRNGMKIKQENEEITVLCQ